MSKKVEEQRMCPYCGLYVSQARQTILNHNVDSAYSLTRRKTKIWFHRSCYLQNVRGHNNEN